MPKKNMPSSDLKTSTSTLVSQSPMDQEQSATEQGNATGAINRQWQILGQLPSKTWIGTRDIQDRLALEGIHVNLRSIQRDLNQLAERFPIENNQKVPQGWRWQKGAQGFHSPLMTSTQALTFMMVEEHLRHLLPAILLQEMRPWFDQARRSMVTEKSQVKDWVNHVRIIPPTQPLIPPKLNSDAQSAIYEAMLQNKQVNIKYQKRGAEAGEFKEYRLNPLALIQRGPIIYLVCTPHDKEDYPDNLRLFVLSRCIDASISTQKLVTPPEFDLDAYIASGAMGYGLIHDEPIETVQVKLSFTKDAGQSLLESKLSEDQELTFSEETGEIQVTATVPLTQQLVWWLRGFGQGLTRISPEILEMHVWEGQRVSEPSL